MDSIFDENGLALSNVSLTVYGYDSMYALIGPYTANLTAGMSLPINATDVVPPVVSTGFIPVFDPSGKVWSLSEDHRGDVVYDKTTQLQSKVNYLGAYRSGVTPIKPDSTFDTWNDTTNSWDEDEAQVSAQNAAALSLKMTSEIGRAGEVISITEDKLELSYFNPGETAESLTASLKQWELYRLQCSSFQNGYTSVQPYAPDSKEFAEAAAAAASAAAEAQREADLAAAQKAEEAAAAAAADQAAAAKTSAGQAAASTNTTGTTGSTGATGSTDTTGNTDTTKDTGTTTTPTSK